jgi:hypothetical protein
MSARPDPADEPCEYGVRGLDEQTAIHLSSGEAPLSIRERVGAGVDQLRDRLDRTEDALVETRAALDASDDRVRGLRFLLESAFGQRDDYHDELAALQTRNDRLHQRVVVAYALAVIGAASLLVTLGLRRLS